MWGVRGRTVLWEKKGGDEERVGGKLHDASLALTPDPADNHSAGLEQTAIRGVDTIVAVVGLSRLRGAVEGGCTGTRDDGDRFPLSDEGTRQARNDQAGVSRSFVFFVVGVPEP